MKIISFSEIKEEFINNLRRNMLIPVLGSGFTCGYNSFNGKVPSGEEYREYMFKEVCDTVQLSEDDVNQLKTAPFSTISSLYYKKTTVDKQKSYLRDNFSQVKLDVSRSKFLEINWPYIYTLNIDDGIEENSDYRHKIISNRAVEKNIYDYKKCVIKLHGDIDEILTYQDPQSEVLTLEQYVSSLKKNESLLTKLNHDIIYQNIIYIGCSLQDEIDLLTISSDSVKTSRYICAVKEPGLLDKHNYERFGITHVVLFKSYDSIYQEIYKAWIESNQIRENELDSFKLSNVNSNKLLANYEANKAYLFYGKSLIDTGRSIVAPYYFISRDKTSSIVKNISCNTVQFVLGNGCSGRTYMMIDIAWRTRDRDVFVFETRDSISEAALDVLLKKNNCLILVDSNVLSLSQIERIIENRDALKKSNVNFIIFESKNNRDLSGLLTFLEMNKKILAKEINKEELSNRLTKSELDCLNPLLTSVNIGIFSSDNKTIVDNIIEKSNLLYEKNKYQRISPKFNTVPEIAVLLSLAVEKKLYSEKVIQFDFLEEMSLQVKSTMPLIEQEATWSFEKSNSQNSPIKYVVNAEYWLCRQLAEYAKKAGENQDKIVDAFHYIITKIIQHEGKPSLMIKNNNVYKSYILFDNINRIFSYKEYGSLQLIRKIYEKLNTLLSTDPSYMHQRAKCYIKSMLNEKNMNDKLTYLDKAFRDCAVAKQVFEERYKISRNEKILISIAHVQYTQSIIECHRCNLNNYQDARENQLAVELLHETMISPYNPYSYAISDSINKDNVIEKLVNNLLSCDGNLNRESKSRLTILFNIIRGSYNL